MQRYHVDAPQAKRVAKLACRLLTHLVPDAELAETESRIVTWAARLHEIGISVAYSGYHKHSAYIVRNADMPGFSRMEQERLALLLLAHRGQLRKVGELTVSNQDWPLVTCLRLAALLLRSRTDIALPELGLTRVKDGFELEISGPWLGDNPLTETALHEETRLWRGSGMSLELRVSDADGAPLLSAA